MHKDPPPGVLERGPKVIIIYGLLTGFIAGVVVFGAWSLFSAGQTPSRQQPSSLIDNVPK